MGQLLSADECLDVLLKFATRHRLSDNFPSPVQLATRMTHLILLLLIISAKMQLCMSCSR